MDLDAEEPPPIAVPQQQPGALGPEEAGAEEVGPEAPAPEKFDADEPSTSSSTGPSTEEDAEPSARPSLIRSLLRPEHLVLAAITALAAAAYAWGLDHGTLNVYYSAAVRSMAHNWHDFLYGSFDAQGTISIDKLPGSLWLQALSVRAFGYHVWAMMLPQVVAGALLVPATYRAAGRVAGPRAGLAAALIVAATPAALAEARGNEADPVSVLLIVLAADAVLRAATRDRLRPLLAAAVWLGLAFQVKMGEAWLPVPALAAGYVLTAPGSLRRRAAHLAAAGATLAAVSLSWMVVIAATPAGHRPYVDGSADNSVFSQVFGYNGFGRFEAGSSFGLPRTAAPTPESLAYARQSLAIERHLPAGSTAAWNRLLSGDIGREAGWLLPVALVAGGAILVARRRTPRTDPQRAAVVVFGGWLVTDVIVFSAARSLLPYYTAMLVPSVAVLCALGLKNAVSVSAADSRVGRRTVLVAVAFVAAAAWCAWLSHSGGFVAPVLTLALAAAAVAATRLTGAPRAAVPTLALAAVLAGPVAGSGWLLAHGGSAWDAPYSAIGTIAEPDAGFVAALRAHPSYGAPVLSNAKGSWDKLAAFAAKLPSRPATSQYQVVFTTAVASFYAVEGVSDVLPVGGYTGQVPTPSLAQLAALLDQHRIFAAELPGPMDTHSADPRLRLLEQHCTTAVAEKQDDSSYYFICQ